MPDAPVGWETARLVARRATRDAADRIFEAYAQDTPDVVDEGRRREMTPAKRERRNPEPRTEPEHEPSTENLEV